MKHLDIRVFLCGLLILGAGCNYARSRSLKRSCAGKLRYIAHYADEWATAHDGLFPTNCLFLGGNGDIAFYSDIDALGRRTAIVSSGETFTFSNAAPSFPSAPFSAFGV